MEDCSHSFKNIKTSNDKKMWLKDNLINEDNLPYMESILTLYNIEYWKDVVNGSESLDLLVTNKGKNYKLSVDEEYCKIIVLERNVALNPKQKEKYHWLKDFEGIDAFMEAIIYIHRRINYGIIKQNID